MASEQIDPLVDRLGLAAFADNKFTNIYEDLIYGLGGTGQVSIQAADDSWLVRSYWDEVEINYFCRAYTRDGWQVHERTVKRYD